MPLSGMGEKKEEYPNYFTVNNSIISEKKEIANAFNSFFVSVGPKLANGIVQSNNAKEFEEINIKNNLNSLFIDSVSEREIVEIVHSFKTKRTTDGFGFSTSIENSEYAVGVFIDLSKAFDTIDHSLLLNKFERYGVRVLAHAWLKSYLSDRNQYVHINGISSKEAKITHGVPQGSVLGPKLFIMYINEISEVLNKLQCILFADDTSLYGSGKDLELLLNSVETEHKILKKWFEVNKLSVNLHKTKYIVFGNKVVNKLCRLKIGEIEIERVYVIKFLGINIDDKLNWKVHINILKTKISKRIAILCKIKTSVNKNTLYILYNSLILPYLSYCVEIWGNTYKTNIQPIFLLQKKAIE